MTQALDLDFSSNLDRLPPQNIEAEEAILGGILLDPEAIERVVDMLQPEALYIPAHRDIYAAARALHRKGKPTDLLQIINYLQDFGLLERVGGRNKLASLMDCTVSAVNIDSLAELVIEKHRRRQLIKAGNKIISLGYNQENDLNEQLNTAEEQILSIRNDFGKPEDDGEIGETLVSLFNDIEALHLGLKMPYLRTGFYDLDAFLGGLLPGQLIVLGARPSMGKSALAFQIAYNLSASYRKRTLIYSYEMSKKQILLRMLSSEAGIDSGNLKSGSLSQTHWESLSRAIGVISELPMFIDDSCPTLSELSAKIRRSAAMSELGLIVIDYLQLIGGLQSSGNRAQDLGEATRTLKTLATKCGVPILVLSQLSRAVEARTNKRPLMSDLRDSGSIEADADVVLGVYRDDYYHPDSSERGIAEIPVLKNRDGATGTIKLLFDAQFASFKNLARGID